MHESFSIYARSLLDSDRRLRMNEHSVDSVNKFRTYFMRRRRRKQHVNMLGSASNHVQGCGDDVCVEVTLHAGRRLISIP